MKGGGSAARARAEGRRRRGRRRGGWRRGGRGWVWEEQEDNVPLRLPPRPAKVGSAPRQEQVRGGRRARLVAEAGGGGVGDRVALSVKATRSGQEGGGRQSGDGVGGGEVGGERRDPRRDRRTQRTKSAGPRCSRCCPARRASRARARQPPPLIFSRPWAGVEGLGSSCEVCRARCGLWVCRSVRVRL